MIGGAKDLLAELAALKSEYRFKNWIKKVKLDLVHISQLPQAEVLNSQDWNFVDFCERVSQLRIRVQLNRGLSQPLRLALF